MIRNIKTVTDKYKLSSLEFIENVFSEYKDNEEWKTVRSLVEEFRSKKYYISELELIMVLLLVKI